MPRHYRIWVSPALRPMWGDRFEGLTLLDAEGGRTEIAGLLPDQAALHGVLAHVRDLGLTLLAIVSHGLGEAADQQG